MASIQGSRLVKVKSSDEVSVSVVIPNFNYGRFLGACLDSVLAQTRLPIEIIVVDNFSEDNSEKVSTSFESPLIRFVKFQNHGSIGAARNYGWRIAQGNHIAFLDSDDVWFPEKLSRQMKLHALAAPSLSYHDFELMGGNFPRLARGRSLGRNPKLDLLTGGNAILTSGVVISKALLEKSGGFPEEKRYVGAEDLGLWLKIAELTARFDYIPRVMGAYRVHDSISHVSDSSLPAMEVTSSYRSELSLSQIDKLEGWLAYARSGSIGFSPEAAEDLVVAIKKGSIRFKWRAALRFAKLSFEKFGRRYRSRGIGN